MLKEFNVFSYALHLNKNVIYNIMRNLSIDKCLIKNIRVIILKLLYYCVAI